MGEGNAERERQEQPELTPEESQEAVVPPSGTKLGFCDPFPDDHFVEGEDESSWGLFDD